MDTAVRFSERNTSISPSTTCVRPFAVEAYIAALSEDDLSSGMLTWLKYPRHVFQAQM